MPEITTQRNLVNWPKDIPIDVNTVFEIIDAHAIETINDQHVELDHDLKLDYTNVNIHNLGPNNILLRAVNPATKEYATKTIELDIVKHSQADPQTLPLIDQHSQIGMSTHHSKNQPISRPKKKHTKLYTILTIILVLVIALFTLHACHQKKQQAHHEAVQSSKIAQNSSSISHLQGQNAALKRQLANLKQAVKQYQQDKDTAALQQQLNQIKQADAQQEQNATGTTLEAYKALDRAIDAINQNPDQAQKIIDGLDASNPTGWWNTVKNTLAQYF